MAVSMIIAITQNIQREKETFTTFGDCLLFSLLSSTCYLIISAMALAISAAPLADGCTPSLNINSGLEVIRSRMSIISHLFFLANLRIMGIISF